MEQKTVSVFLIPLLLICIVLLVIPVSGCTTFQSPKVLEEGRHSFTVGVLVFLLHDYMEPNLVWFDIHAGYRTYLAENYDMGLDISYNWVKASIVADVKYQIIDQPFYLASSIGCGFVVSCTNPGSDESANFDPILQALMIGGSSSFYGGMKGIYNLDPGEKRIGIEEMKNGSPLTGYIFGGATVGEGDDLIIEASHALHNADRDKREYLGITSIGAGYRFLF